LGAPPALATVTLPLTASDKEIPMNKPLRARLAWPAVAATTLLLSAAPGAHAASNEADPARVHVVGQLSLRDACPGVDPGDLADQLVPAWDAAAKPSTVEVSFRVQRQHVYDVAPATDSPRLFHQIRHALHGLRCDGGDDQAHSVRLLVRFVDGSGARLAVTDAADAGR
jgi:hypothetical protein